MRKNDLIKLLGTIKGNPEIVLWNGFVEDYQQIEKELVCVDLHKLTFEGYKDRVNMQQLRAGLAPMLDDELKSLYRTHKVGEWELFSYYPPDKENTDFRKKTVYLLEPKAAGKTTHDRSGSISY